MASKIPSQKYSAINTQFNPYGRPSLRSLRKTVNAYDMQEMEWGIKASIDSYERELRQREDEVSRLITNHSCPLNTCRTCRWDRTCLSMQGVEHMAV